MNRHAALSPFSSTNPDKPDAPGSAAGGCLPATHNAPTGELNAGGNVSDEDESDWDNDDESATETGLNPDPDYEKMGGDIELMLPEDDDDDELSSDDADDDRM